jgi:hypothetical protein
MAMVKATAAGAAVGALALATILFVAPIAAQGPGGPPTGRSDITGPVPRGGDITGPAAPQRRNPNDPDITGPRGEVAICQDRLAQVAQVRLQRIALLVRPTEEQRAAFEELRMASAKALEVVRAACPGERPLTPTARMVQAEKWLEARLQAIRLLRPPLEAFYRQLSDEQKIRWSMGPRSSDRYGRDRREPADEYWQDWRRAEPDRREDERSGESRRGDDRRPRWGDERRRDEQDRYGDERGRGSDDRYGQRWRDDDRYRWRDERWRDERGRDEPRREERWRERGRRSDADEERL